MNRLSTAKRIQVIAALVEGNSINATCRMFGVGKHTVLRLLEDAGCACAAYHHSYVRGLRVRRLQADEIWARVTPAMEAGLTDHVWALEELCGLLPERKPNAQADKDMITKALEKLA